MRCEGSWRNGWRTSWSGGCICTTSTQITAWRPRDRVAELMGGELGWDEARIPAEAARYAEFAAAER